MKRKKKSRGIITVFVTLMLVPMVVCTGTMVDAARLKLYSSQAAMVADAYGEVVLSEYDNLLKDLYGLFSVTQKSDGLDAIDSLADYSKYSFNPNGDEDKSRGISGYMPYGDAEVTISYEKILGSTLAENDVLTNQINEFMKFRVVEAMLGTNMLEKLQSMESADTDRKVVEKRQELTEDCNEILDDVDEYYKVLKVLSQYPDYIEERKKEYVEYSDHLVAIVNNKRSFGTYVYNPAKSVYDYEWSNVTYEEYVYYLDHQEMIDDAVALFEEKEEAEAEKKEEEEKKAEKEAKGEEYAMKNIVVPNVTSTDRKNAQDYVDADRFEKSVKEFLSGDTYNDVTKSSKAIKFGEVESKVKELEKISNKITSALKDLEKKMDEINGMLPSCNESLRKSMEDELSKLKGISENAGNFEYTVNKLKEKDIAGKDKTNYETWKTEVEKLDDVKSDVLKGDHGVKNVNWATSISLYSYDFTDEKVDKTISDFYEALKKMCAKSSGSGEGDKNAGDKEVQRAEEAAKNAKKDIEGNEETKARNINDKWTVENGDLEPSKGESDVGSNWWSGGISFGSIVGTAMDKFLLTTYNFGMFSNRVTSIEPPEKEEKTSEATPTATPADSEKEDEEYKEYSLTKVEMSRDVNYLYEAELEYLVAGNNNSVKNLNYVRNVICAVRAPMNFLSTYTISEVNDAINRLAQIAFDAVAATGVAAWVAPVVYITVSAALRTTVATLETVADWSELKDREEVIFYKSDIDDMTALPKIGDFLGGMESGSKDEKKSSEFGLSYEDYLYAMMLLFTEPPKLLNRTSNLITLNVNQSQNTTGKDLETLDFKMKNTITAIKSTCQINEKFLIVPDNFAEMFIAPDSKADSTIQMLDDGSYAYSVIRGY